MKREVRVQDAIGLALAHDLTRIVPGQFKGRAFVRGYVIKQEDIPALLAIGKEHIYVLEIESHEAHEEEAAQQMALALAQPGLVFTVPHEGKITAKATHPGLLRVNVVALEKLNAVGDLAVVTKRDGTALQSGMAVAAFRAIPLVIGRDKLQAFDDIVATHGPVLQVLPYLPLKVGVVTTGSEVFSGRIKDRFGSVLQEKIANYSLTFLGQTIVGDTQSEIVHAIRAWCAAGSDLVLVTGGMSVDPDDRSPGAIRVVADEVVSYGMPVLPGSMSMLAYAGDVAIMGLPGCVIYDAITVFDWLLPRIAAGERLTRAAIGALGHGGLIG